jgi:multicomponent K+:H+ antiporter subunit G
MNHLADIPLWIALPVAFLVVAGSSLALLGTIGLLRLRLFYDRLHAPTLGTSWGIGAIVLGSMLLFSWLDSRPVLHEALIGIFVIVTTPATYLLLGRAAIHRDRAKGSANLPNAAAEGADPPKETAEDTVPD